VIEVRRKRIDLDWAFYGWLTFRDEHERWPEEPKELVEHLLTMNPALARDGYAEQIVERFWPDLVCQEEYRKSKLLVESEPNAPRLARPA
jgi:hypothetical protein